jgi:NitT/TauT family transport system substrate-binding protein
MIGIHTQLRTRHASNLILIVLLVAPSLVTLSCSPGSTPPKSRTAQTSLTIGYSRLRISLPLFVAQEKGIFSKHGIKADLVMYDTAQPMMQALVEGKIEIAGYTAMPITYSGMARSGAKLLFATTMVEDQGHRISYLLRAAAKSGSQPVIRGISNLKGKKVGILPTTAYAAWLKVILRANGVDPDRDVVIQPIAPEQEAAALRSGGVDALFTGDPVATAAIRAGIAELITNTVECPKYIEDPFAFGSFNISKNWADTHPDERRRLVAAIDEAAEYVNQHPDEAKQTMVPYLQEQFRADVERYPNARYLLTDQSTEAMYQHLAELYLKMGIINQPVSLAGLVVTKQ